MDKEYGVVLDVDLSLFKAKLDKATNEVKQATKEIKSTTRDIKVTGVEGLDKIKVDTAPIKELNKELNNTLDIKKRIETGQIKIFDNRGFNEDFAKAEAEYEKIRLANSGFIDWSKIKQDQLAFDQLGESVNEVSNDLNEATNSGNNFLLIIGKALSRKLGRQTYLGSGFFNDTFFKNAKEGDASLKSLSGSLLKLGGAVGAFYGVKKLFDIAMNSIKKAKEETEKYRKIVLSVFSAIGNGAKKILETAANYIVNFFNKALSSYMSFDQQLSKNIQNVWVGLGSFLAPILEYVVSLFQRLLAYINATIKVLTGVDFIARANAKAMDGVASSAAKATKALAGFDEIQNINQETGGGGGITGSTIEIPDVDTSHIESFAQKIKEMIEKDDWFSVGLTIRDKIISGLDSIPWEEIQAKAGKIGKKLAEFLNGLLTPNIDGKTLGGSLGTALANAINTALEFLDGFLTTIDWDLVADNIIDFIVKSIENIKWEKVISVAQKIANGILKILKAAINKLNEKLPEWLDAFEKFLHSAEGQEFLNSIAQIITTWQELKDQVSTIIDGITEEVKGILMEKLGKEPWAVKFASAYAKVGTGGLFGAFFSNAEEEVKTGSAKVSKQSYESGNKSGESYKEGYNDADIVSTVADKYEKIEETNGSWSVKISKEQYDAGNKTWESYNNGAESVDTETPAKDKVKETIDAMLKELDITGGKSKKTAEIGHSAGAGYTMSLDETDTTTPAQKLAQNTLDSINNVLGIVGATSTETQNAGDITGTSFTTGLDNSDAIKESKEYFESVFREINGTVMSVQSDTNKAGSGVGSSLSGGIETGFAGAIHGALGTVKNGLNQVIGLFNQSATNIGNNYSVKLKGSIANGVNTAFNVAQDVISGISAQIHKVPYLRIGTNEVYSEGLAYLHAGERIVPADVAKGGYDSTDNKETNMLLRVLIDTLENKEFRASIGKDDVGRASVDYINKMKRITGGSVV